MKELLKKIGTEIKQNYPQLILAFVLAMGAWLLVSVQVFPTIEQKVNSVPIEAKLTDLMLQNNLQIVSNTDSVVDIRIEGKRYDISGLKNDDFAASVDLSQVRGAGTYTVPVSVVPKSDVELSISDVDPAHVTLVIDEIVTREFPVKGTAPNISLPEGYYVDEITAEPNFISITGSASVLDKITSIEARSTFEGEINESHEAVGELFIFGANGVRIINDSLKLSSEIVSVNIPIFKQKELPLKFSLANYPANFNLSSLKFTVSPETITVAAPDDSIDYLSELDIGTIDIADIKLNQSSIIPITLPDGYKNLSGNPTARITWDIEDYSKLDFTVVDKISLINVPDNYKVSLITSAVTITVIGPSDAMSTLTAEDFYITANLLGFSLREGTQDINVSVNIRGTNQRCWVSGTYKVTIDAQQITGEQQE